MSKGFHRLQDLLSAINEERKAEEVYFSNLSANKTIAERVDSGILWFPVVNVSTVYTVGEQIEMSFERTKNLDSPHKLKAGVGCRIFKYDSAKEFSALKGVVSYVKKNKLAVILNEQVVSKSDLIGFKGQLGIELIYDDRPYKVMEQAINEVIKSGEPKLVALRDTIENQKASPVPPSDHRIDLHELNESQVVALNGVMQCPELGIIHGPPGTGKTTTLVQVIRHLTKEEKRILVCAPSNNAVDLLAMELDKIGINTLRVGNVSRIGDGTTHLALAEKARNHSEWQHIKKVKIEANEARRLAGKHKRSFGPKERSDRNAMYRESKELRKWAKDLESRLLEKIIAESQVICSTLIGVSHRSLEGLKFRTLIIDEASQALEPECWNAILKAERVILAGDHMQLAPTVKSSEAIKLGLSDTLLARMTDKIPSSYLLNVQYRMNEKILSFSNHRFYDNKLSSGITNSDWSIDDEPLTLIDSSGCGFDEVQNLRTLSRYNEGEGFILREHFLQHKEVYEGLTIGIISPYSEQVKYLRNVIEDDEFFHPFDITVNSIDGFQGQESDVIYISLVRSNSAGEIGFLADERRLNVAMTRAKKKLVIIGDMSTLSQNKLFHTLADHVEATGSYKSAWEYMQV